MGRQAFRQRKADGTIDDGSGGGDGVGLRPLHMTRAGSNSLTSNNDMFFMPSVGTNSFNNAAPFYFARKQYQTFEQLTLLYLTFGGGAPGPVALRAPPDPTHHPPVLELSMASSGRTYHADDDHCAPNESRVGCSSNGNRVSASNVLLQIYKLFFIFVFQSTRHPGAKRAQSARRSGAAAGSAPRRAGT